MKLTKRRTLALGLLAVALVPLGGLTMLSLFSKTPTNLGVHDGRLAPCPPTPNCVCTQCDDPQHHMPPIPFTGDAASIKRRIRQVVENMPRAKIVEESDNWLRAEFKSAIFRFVDDVEFLIDEPAQIVHFRSASRVGYSDLQANRKRMAAITGALTERP